MKFTNWKSPSVKQLLKEYKIEHDTKGNKLWGNKREFIDAVRNAKVERITREADRAIDYRSSTKDKGQLLSLIKGYRSYPKYRNEGTLNAIYNGYAKNAPMDRPLVVDFGKGGRRVFSGNTRMDAAFHSGIDPEVLVVRAKKFAAKLTGRQQGMKLKEFRYYPGSPYRPQENPYNKDFYEDRDKERKHGLIKAGLLGAGLLGGGALAGRGLFKAGINAAARRADDLVRANASLSDEVAKLRKAAAPAKASKIKVPETIKPAPPQSPPAGSLADSSDAAAEINETLAAAPVKQSKLTPRQNQLKKRAEKVARGAKANEAPAPVAAPKPAPEAKIEAPAAKAKKVKSTVKTSPTSAASEAFVEIPGVGKFPNTGTPEQNVAFREAINKAHAAGRFKGNTAADVVDDIRKSLNKNSEFPPGLSDELRAAARKSNPPLKKGKKSSKVVDDDTAWEESMKVSSKKAPAEKPEVDGSGVESSKKATDSPSMKGVLPNVSNLTPAQRRAIQKQRRKSRRKEFNFVADEGGVPFTGKVARDRFIKKLRDEDLDRRDANILRAGGAGALAGLLFRGGLSRGKRALIGAGIGAAGVVGTRMATERTRDIYGERSRGAKRAESLPLVAGLGAAGYLASRRIRGLAAKLRGVKGLKEFDAYKLYYFRGRNTGIAARSAKEAREKKRRGGDEIVAVRTPNATEKSQMSRGIWVRTRRDGNTPEKSRYGKGRGQGPARKSMGAKLPGLKEFNDPHRPEWALHPSGGSLHVQSLVYKPQNYVPRWGMRRLLASKSDKVRSDAFDQAMRERERRRSLREAASQTNLASRLRAVKFFEKKKREMNPYVGAALSGGASGAVLGGLSILRRGTSPLSALATAGKLGAVSAGIVGGGALLGSKIIGKPRDDEGAPFTKRAGLGGSIAGAAVGLAGALALRKTKSGARILVEASKNWRPAMWIRKSPLAAGISVGTVAGALYGGAQGLDEGQQVDSIRNLKKDLKKELPAAHGQRAAKSAVRSAVHGIGFSSKMTLREFGVWNNAKRWYRGENLNGMQRVSLSHARKVSPKAAQALKAEFIKDNHSAHKLVLGAGVLPPLATTAIGVGATYHSASLGKKKEMSAKFFGRIDQPRWNSPATREHGQFGDPKIGWIENRPMFTNARKIIDPESGKRVTVYDEWKPSSPQLINSLLRDAKGQRVSVQRGGRLGRDVFDEMRGAERQRDASGRIKKREWEKSWFQNKAAEIGIAATGGGLMIGARYAHNNSDTKVGKAYSNAKLSIRSTKSNLADIGGSILKGATNITRRRFSAKLAKLRELDAVAEYAGWDVRDPRGRSARVFAPGSRRRERRPKEWHEKTENERKLWKMKVAAGVLGGAGLALIGQRLVSGKSLIPSRFVPKQPNSEVFVDAAKMFRPGAA
jgi:hypothetical protein